MWIILQLFSTLIVIFVFSTAGDGMRGGGPGYMEPYDESGYQNGPGGGGYDHFGERYPPGPMDGYVDVHYM